MPAGVTQILAGATATGAGSAVTSELAVKTYQAWGCTTSGAGAATINIEGSINNGETWDVIGTITLTLATSKSGDGFTSMDRYPKVRANVTALSGTGATVSVVMGS